MSTERAGDPTKSTVRYRPDATTWPGRPWESKCWRPDCGHPFGWTWHLTWHSAWGRAWKHLLECPALVHKRDAA